MRNEDIFEAVGQIDEEWIEEAGTKTVDLKAKRDKKSHKFKLLIGAMAAALALVLAPNLSPNVATAYAKTPILRSLVKVVLFRDYVYEDGNYKASVRVPQVEVDAEGTDATNELLKESAANVNASVEELTDQIIAEFKEKIASDTEGTGMGAVDVGYEVVTDTDQYFTLKVWTLETAADAAETDYYYTIDRTTGEEITLSDLFSDATYVQTITDEIKSQMRDEMKQDEGKLYWLDQEDDMFEFKSIAEDQSFYIDAKGQLVIAFNEGDVAPMYMGAVTFTMPEDIWSAGN